jgi:hypothetical protein
LPGATSHRRQHPDQRDRKGRLVNKGRQASLEIKASPEIKVESEIGAARAIKVGTEIRAEPDFRGVRVTRDNEVRPRHVLQGSIAIQTRILEQ